MTAPQNFHPASAGDGCGATWTYRNGQHVCTDHRDGMLFQHSDGWALWDGADLFQKVR